MQPIREVSPAAARPAVYQAPASQPAASGWSLTSTLLVIAMAIVAVGVVVLAQRTARRRRAAQLTALTA